MRILLIAPVYVRVRPDAAGPGGQVALLAEGLAARGHEVTVRTSEPAFLPVPVEQLRLPVAGRPEEAERIRRLYAVRALAGADRFEAIHSFAGPDVALRAAELDLPALSTPDDHTAGLLRGVPVRYAAQSWSHAEAITRDAPTAAIAGVLYPALPVDDLPFEVEKDGYLVALGPIGPGAGSDIALAAARKAEVPLLLLGPAAPGASQFIDTAVAPRLDDVLVRMVQPASAEERRRLIARASGVLLTTRVRRPWERCAAEALAMGTPVITLDRGVARELVLHGETGYIASDLAGLVAGIDRIDAIDPRACRRRAYHLWDMHQAAATAEDLYTLPRRLPAGMRHPHPEFVLAEA